MVLGRDICPGVDCGKLLKIMTHTVIKILKTYLPIILFHILTLQFSLNKVNHVAGASDMAIYIYHSHLAHHTLLFLTQYPVPLIQRHHTVTNLHIVWFSLYRWNHYFIWWICLIGSMGLFFYMIFNGVEFNRYEITGFAIVFWL